MDPKDPLGLLDPKKELTMTFCLSLSYSINVIIIGKRRHVLRLRIHCFSNVSVMSIFNAKQSYSSTQSNTSHQQFSMDCDRSKDHILCKLFKKWKKKLIDINTTHRFSLTHNVLMQHNISRNLTYIHMPSKVLRV